MTVCHLVISCFSVFILARYFPETIEADVARYSSVTDLRAMMENAGLARWRETEIRADVVVESAEALEAKAFSVLHLIPQPAFERGLARLTGDLERGPPSAFAPALLMLWASK